MVARARRLDHGAHGAGGARPHRRVLSAAGGRGGLGRNALWNLVGVALPFVAGLATIPILAHELGAARFGLIGLAWAVLEYLTLLDAGLGRATVHFVARGRREPGGVAGDVVSAAVLGQLLLGVAGGAGLAALAPWLVDGVLGIDAALRDEARSAFLVLAATVPLVLLGLALRGILEGAERFDLAAAVRIPSSTATFVVPAIGALAGLDVPGILLALLGVRALACVATALLARRAVPELRWAWPRSWRQLRPVASFGGWVAVSNVVSPVFLLYDRLVLGAVLGVAAVGLYTGPYEAAVRLLVLPAAFTGALFPRAAAAAVAGLGSAELAALYGRAVRVLAVVMLVVLVPAIAAAPDLLRLWLGPAVADATAVAARLLLAGVLLNAIGHVPFAFVQAMGRPDLTARFHLAELALHLPVTLLLVSRFGIAGAAAAWALRAALDAALVLGAAHRLLGLRVAEVFAGRWLRLVALVSACVATLAALRLSPGVAPTGPAAGLAGVAIVAGAFAALAWGALLRPDDRAALLGAFARRGRG